MYKLTVRGPPRAGRTWRDWRSVWDILGNVWDCLRNVWDMLGNMCDILGMCRIS